MSNSKENSNNNKTLIIVGILIVLTVIGSYFIYNKNKGNESDEGVLGVNRVKTDFVDTTPQVTGVEGTFDVDTSLPVCKEDGLPVVYLFSTTWCPHCEWIKDTFDKVAKEYMNAGKLFAYHYELDTKDDTLTSGKENNVPQEALNVYKRFNPNGSIPTFVVGCKYWRVGNGFEASQDLNAEEKELRAIFDKVIADSK
ncbi:hypothetical protein A2X44_04050 [candidate division CPR3 bacterium GWF2_35_18]|uniref:Thioredoxin domain-containing protein n=1 Tax=candidate division CPR3 bacterium GW2011_GWF2_35_18 TaxID=1618350 RepID=A0A0G0EQX8_UNCC3|nr:MAG: hypothetical protein UR67_C0004G0099 [candidate division CPR3 bacterium GW2011_GWF2_35_18]OGB63180.1 MAG: hypothetical protein A2X44_04050 [candidate division CPR3 bacterium GWF2_35_18]OGB64006.1 MAG: hypothetical protein A2250_04340 [candidate division CPR3 bacterium RIFOXYA2_FULL_35_13]OGB76654.1 MAG: hypothetical protein A2476_00240 [candidate division CPR3 bacterium RIFOXYC2_FULL_35_7]OGB79595.1 MAG: hypothetical protein A2296_03740 [candidate division CPR3 bacterium RIFOXYB2_FULL_3